jgi:molecular chaperone Hsp33
VISVVGTKLVSDAVSRHKTSPTATAALGRAMLAATLLGTFKGDNETTQITFKGDGPIGQIIVISDNTGQVKGMVSNPLADPPLRPDGKLNVGAAVGRGVLTVSRAHPDWKAPFNGMVQITTGEIAEDIAVYMQESEQVNSAIAVGVSLDRSLNVRSAGGYMVQVLPFASDETVSILEKTIPSLPSATDMIAEGLTAQQMAEKVLGALGSLPEVATTSVPTYGPCDVADLRKRMMRALASMGEAEIQSIIEEQGEVEVTCEFCKHAVVFTEEELLGASKEV